MHRHAQTPTSPKKRAIGPEIAPGEPDEALWWLVGHGRRYGPFMSAPAGWWWYFSRTPQAAEVRAAEAAGWSMEQGPGAL